MTKAFELSADRSRLDLDVVHDFLSNSAYWSLGITKDKVARAVLESEIIAAYDREGAQIGFARVITDHATFAYLADVFVLPAHQGQGIARHMVADLIARMTPYGIRQILLVTRDAHGVYSKLGFTPVENPGRFMRLGFNQE
jgi:GNAT superfamily N-acetyltransferase